ncbi:MAG: sulfite exporter TauE/SafE family protein [Aliarcobacter sp.]|nr:sulfite exporter TauE/SafE family protein [Aliarcobacter sp.]
MSFELAIFGIITGFSSGFFGIGGGTILVPMLLATGFVMKEAVAISIMQMVFSSIYGSFLNSKKIKNFLKDGIIIGIGGSIGGAVSGYIVPDISNESLQYLFIAILIFSTIRIFYSPAEQSNEKQTKNQFILVIIGFFIGILAMSIGVGGSILLTPILVGFLKYDLKAATALGLFFVIFSSIAGFNINFISWTNVICGGCGCRDWFTYWSLFWNKSKRYGKSNILQKICSTFKYNCPNYHAL